VHSSIFFICPGDTTFITQPPFAATLWAPVSDRDRGFRSCFLIQIMFPDFDRPLNHADTAEYAALNVVLPMLIIAPLLLFENIAPNAV